MNTAEKIAALDRLASAPSAAPNERENAARAAASLRARQPDASGASAIGGLLELARRYRQPATTEPERPRAVPHVPRAPAWAVEHDGVSRPRDGAARCMAATPGGARCPREAKFGTMCRKCARRGAPLWTRKERAHGA